MSNADIHDPGHAFLTQLASCFWGESRRCGEMELIVDSVFGERSAPKVGRILFTRALLGPLFKGFSEGD